MYSLCMFSAITLKKKIYFFSGEILSFFTAEKHLCILHGRVFVMFSVIKLLSGISHVVLFFPPGVWAGILNLTVSINRFSILTLHTCRSLKSIINLVTN